MLGTLTLTCSKMHLDIFQIRSIICIKINMEHRKTALGCGVAMDLPCKMMSIPFHKGFLQISGKR
jgi:hypothetical protein